MFLFEGSILLCSLLTARQCPTPGKPPSGLYFVYRQRKYVQRGPFQYGDTVRWFCSKGFTGNTDAVCQANSTWSKNTPTCTRTYFQELTETYYRYVLCFYP